MKPELQIGKTLKPRGLAGEIKIQFYSSSSKRYKNLKSVKLDGKDFEIEHLSISGEFGFAKFKGVNTIDDAELIRNKVITAKREDLPELENGAFYIVDIIGMNVIVNDKIIGQIYDVLQYGSADVYCVKTKDSTLSFPAIKALLKEVNLEENKMILDQEIFNNVVVYD